jgi:hypothetical protein
MRRRILRTLVAVSAAAATCATLPATGAGDPPAAATSGPLLPDLDQQTPTELQAARTDIVGPARYALGFQSAVRNIGDGPLLISGRRASTRTPFMTAQQLIQHGDGSQTVVSGAGRLRYAVALSHQHWHYLGFDRYELRRAGGDRALLRDHKSGFCLGDRYRVADAVPASAPATPQYRGGCGLYKPHRLTVSEGISVGYGDNYLPYLEGQSLPLTGLAAGRYVLVHRANVDRRLRETNYDNDAASVLLDLRWHNGVPAISTLATCPDSARCDAPAATASRGRAATIRVPLIARAAVDLQRRTWTCWLPARGASA